MTLSPTSETGGQMVPGACKVVGPRLPGTRARHDVRKVEVDTMTKHHPDGTVCLEGTRSLPKSYSPCCEIFDSHTSTCEYDLRYEWGPRSRQWVIAIAESAGGGGVRISYCPHCGARLKPETRQRR